MPTERDWQVARTMHDYWASFAKTGVPDCPRAPTWPAYDPERDELMEFGDDGLALQQGLRESELDWNEEWFLAPLVEH